MSQAIIDITAERERQITKEGWDFEHDDRHTDGELATAAACYAMAGGADKSNYRLLREKPPSFTSDRIRFLKWLWPWSMEWWKPTTQRRDLVIAAALIVAEIERIDRKALRDG